MYRIDFLNNPKAYSNDDEFIAFLPNTCGADELHFRLSEVLRFPNYYGGNWNALYDCLRDFSWIDKKGIVLVHIELPKLTVDELRIYLNIISAAIEDWKVGEEHYFKVIFPIGTEKMFSDISA